MPKVSVYLSDELYRRAQHEGLSISSLTQAAVEEAIAAKHNRSWIDVVRDRPDRTDRVIDTGALISEVRDEFGA